MKQNIKETYKLTSGVLKSLLDDKPYGTLIDSDTLDSLTLSKIDIEEYEDYVRDVRRAKRP